MSTGDGWDRREAFVGTAVEATIRIGFVVLLAAWCFQIVRPFVGIVAWGAILALAGRQGYERIAAAVGGRRGLAAVLFTVLALVLLAVPTALLSGTFVEGARKLAGQLSGGTLHIPPPPESVAGWPLIGEPLARFWTMASENLKDALAQVQPQLKALAAWLLAAAASLGLQVLQFVLAIVIAGVLLAHSEGAADAAEAVATRIVGRRGPELTQLADATVRSVARGIIGVALIQSALAGIGFLVAGVPGAGLWALICLVLAIVQIGPAIILLGAIVYVFSKASTLTAVLFLVWCVFVGLLDNVLKPILLGRGVNVPMVVIFLGAIGGFLAMGLIGLFVGSIVLVLGYTLFLAWLSEARPASEPQEAES